ncbi:hypothetical protein HPB52_023768 [Rhipicephalus sanguineus]|uniref:Uncharacterized protein n=1 Tax=Rhipicephalus sanguineus TaxID=34632 RepID=A0A9D4Q4H3_RHISA|nr:hypothetical protein HPB52_023768 [Rhipicephalus sanguineus]
MHYLSECPATSSLADTLARSDSGRPVTVDDLPTILATKRNRAILIRIEGLVDRLLPDYASPQPDADQN